MNTNKIYQNWTTENECIQKYGRTIAKTVYKFNKDCGHIDKMLKQDKKNIIIIKNNVTDIDYTIYETYINILKEQIDLYNATDNQELNYLAKKGRFINDDYFKIAVDKINTESIIEIETEHQEQQKKSIKLYINNNYYETPLNKVHKILRLMKKNKQIPNANYDIIIKFKKSATEEDKEREEITLLFDKIEKEKKFNKIFQKEYCSHTNVKIIFVNNKIYVSDGNSLISYKYNYDPKYKQKTIIRHKYRGQISTNLYETTNEENTLIEKIENVKIVMNPRNKQFLQQIKIIKNKEYVEYNSDMKTDQNYDIQYKEKIISSQVTGSIFNFIQKNKIAYEWENENFYVLENINGDRLTFMIVQQSNKEKQTA